jgi:hypothetical protein
MAWPPMEAFGAVQDVFLKAPVDLGLKFNVNGAEGLYLNND